MSKKEKSQATHIRRTARDWVFDIAIIVFFCLFTLICVFPFYYLLINTISDNDLVTSGYVNFYPLVKSAAGQAVPGIQISNYVALQNVQDLGSSVLVTVARTILGTALMVITSAWAGYLVTKQKMWKRSFWYRFLVITMYFNAGLVPWYMNMLMMGLTDNFLAYIIPGMVAPYNIILVKTYIESIPTSLEESAVIDGATTSRVWLKIILPLSVPILATIAIFGAVGNWNSFQDSLLLMNNRPDLYTLQHRLYIYLNSSSNLGAMMSQGGQVSEQAAQSLLNQRVIRYTVSMVSIIPILLVYPFMQRYFVKGIMLGAVKG
ncbi:MAG: carbohydrate ABC transporter permease [Clostridia bacterium]|nr:carbohydrate ABC transporter permease [Clostridia bacterium]